MEMTYDYTKAMNEGKFLERHYQKKRVNSILSLAEFSNKEILDMGCNAGVLTYLMEREGGKCVGIDISEENIKDAIKYMPENSKCEFYIEDCTKLRFKDESFDIVVFGDVLEHLNNEEREKTLSETKRVLRDGGLILVSAPFKYHPVNRLNFLRQMGTTRKVTNELLDSPFTKKELINLFKSNGLKLNKIYYACYFLNIMAVFYKGDFLKK